MSDSLRSLRTNEWLWANCSGRSCQKSDREQIAQVAHDKWATMSTLLRLLMINEQMSYSLKTFWLKSYFLVCFIYVFWFKEMSDLLIPSFLMSVVSELIRSLTKNKRCEQITQVAHQKWATMSDSLTSLRGNEQSWANRSGRSPKMSEWVNRSFFWANCSFTHFWAKNEWFAWKTDEWISSPERKLLIRIRNKLVKATVEQSILNKLSKKETLDQNILSKLSIKETVYQNILSKMSKGNSWSEYTEQAVYKGNSWSEYTEQAV